VKWLIILAPLAMVFVLSFGAQRMRPATAQLMFWIFSALIGLFARLDLHGVHPHFDRAGSQPLRATFDIDLAALRR